MSLQNLIEERKKELDELIRIQGVSGVRAFHSNSINMIIEGVIKMVNEELEIQNKIQEKAKEIVVVGRQKVNEMLQDKYIRQGKIEALNNIISQLQTLKK